MNGLLVIDKPGGMTSRDVVNRVQRWFPRKTKIGHTGTLDPGATGVLVVCIGAATRLAGYVQAMGKSYASRFRLDAIRVTNDEWPWLDVEVDCGKGTYIRSIARDLGAALGCGGLVQTLRRTRVGPFATEQGVGVDAPPADLAV